MLYKKIHRQYVKEFRKGRKFKYNGFVYEVTGEPHILRTTTYDYIIVDLDYDEVLHIICISTRRIRLRNTITLLD